MAKIDFKAKTNRELLILAVQAINNIDDHLAKLNSTVARHDRELAVLKSASPACGTGRPKDMAKMLAAKWQFWAAIVTIIVGIIYGIGRAYGWW